MCVCVFLTEIFNWAFTFTQLYLSSTALWYPAKFRPVQSLKLSSNFFCPAFVLLLNFPGEWGFRGLMNKRHVRKISGSLFFTISQWRVISSYHKIYFRSYGSISFPLIGVFSRVRNLIIRECISFIREWSEMYLRFHFGFNLVRAAVNCAVQNSASGLEPLSDTIDQRYDMCFLEH